MVSGPSQRSCTPNSAYCGSVRRPDSTLSHDSATRPRGPTTRSAPCCQAGPAGSTAAARSPRPPATRAPGFRARRGGEHERSGETSGTRRVSMPRSLPSRRRMACMFTAAGQLPRSDRGAHRLRPVARRRHRRARRRHAHGPGELGMAADGRRHTGAGGRTRRGTRAHRRARPRRGRLRARRRCRARRRAARAGSRILVEPHRVDRADAVQRAAAVAAQARATTGGARV